MGMFDNIESSTSYEAEGFTVIPDGTKAVVAITGVKVMPANGREQQEFLLFDVMVAEDGPYKDISVGHKLRINHPDDKKAKTAKELLNAYDSNCGGILRGADQSGKEWWKDGAFMTRALAGKKVKVNFRVWEMENEQGQKMKGNWIDGVYPVNAVFSKTEKSDPNATLGNEKPDEDVGF